jgi:hypothetical protein
MQHVLLIDNPLDEATWERLETDDVRALLKARYPAWPATGRIYAGEAAQSNDVTPRCAQDIEKLATYERLVVVIYPENPLVILIAAVAVALIVTVASFLLMPKLDAANVQTASPNNGLSERSNRARPNARIPDIFGTVRSIPDLIARPYRVYEDHRELEIAYMCIGRGAYEVEDVRDGDTLIADILGASVAVYSPFDSPNGGDTPQLLIGTAIGDPVFNTSRLNEVNGQVLKAPNDTAVRSDQDIRFADGGIVEAGVGIDFTDYFEADDEIEIGNGTDTGPTAAPVAIFAAATGVEPNKFVFATYDPTDDFEVGQRILIGQAVWVTTTGGGTGGDIPGGEGGGGEDNPEYPWDQFPEVPGVQE